MKFNTTYRTREAEIMDDLSMEGQELLTTLDEIAMVNRVLGGNRLTLSGVKKLLKDAETSRPISILDAGCGGGDMLRMLADYGKSKNLKFILTGIDANKATVEYADILSHEYDNIEYKQLDLFGKEFRDLKYDIVLCTLTLHHFQDDEIEEIIATFKNNATLGIVINDLHRSSLACRLFSIAGILLKLGPMPRYDGLVSILRGFKKNELKNFAERLDIKSSRIRWRWAFRYQWIIWNNI